MGRFWMALVGSGLLLVGPSVAQAEIFKLANGGKLVGKHLNADEKLAPTYEIETAGGLRLSLARKQVIRVEVQRPIETEYAELQSRAPDTVEAQWKLAEWCRQHNLFKHRKEHLERVVALDTNHTEARRALGFSNVNGQWLTTRQRMEQNGYVFFRGRWRLPQEVELLEQKNKQERAEKEWFRKLKMYRGWLEEPKRHLEAVKFIEEIDDPYAVRALKEFMDEELDWRVRRLYIESLANIESPVATEAMVVRTLVDQHDEVRYTAMDHFEEKDPDIVAMYMRALRSKDNVIINRAAEGLKHMKHRAAIGALIDALVTEHKYKVTIGNPGGGISTTMANPNAAQNAVSPNPGGFPSMGGSPGGIGGISMGSSTKIIKEYRQNYRVLEALVELTGGVNYQFDVARWKLWASSQRSSGGAARRD